MYFCIIKKIFLIVVLSLPCCPGQCSINDAALHYSAIWKSTNDEDAKKAAIQCFTAIATEERTIQNVTRHALKHMLVPVEIPMGGGIFSRSLLCWLTYQGKDLLMGTLRQFLCALYDTGKDIQIIQNWINSSSQELTEVTDHVGNLVYFSKGLYGIRQQIEDETEILHTYKKPGDEEERNYTIQDMLVIDNFIQYLLKYDIDEDSIVNQFLHNPQEAKETILPELVKRQKALFDRFDMMTRKIFKNCFEPCMATALKNVFQLSGITQGATAPPQPAHETTLISDWGKQKGGYIFDKDSSLATTTLCRTFSTVQDFTRFIRALIFITNEGQSQSFELTPGVVRSMQISVNTADPKTKKQVGKLKAPIKAEVQVLEEAVVNGDPTIYKVGDVNYKVISSPILASFYFG